MLSDSFGAESSLISAFLIEYQLISNESHFACSINNCQFGRRNHIAGYRPHQDSVSTSISDLFSLDRICELRLRLAWGHIAGV